jgi:hypothetical protein
MSETRLFTLVCIAAVVLSVGQTLLFNRLIGIPQSMMVTLPISFFLGWYTPDVARLLKKREKKAEIV